MKLAEARLERVRGSESGSASLLLLLQGQPGAPPQPHVNLAAFGREVERVKEVDAHNYLFLL